MFKAGDRVVCKDTKDILVVSLVTSGGNLRFTSMFGVYKSEGYALMYRGKVGRDQYTIKLRHNSQLDVTEIPVSSKQPYAVLHQRGLNIMCIIVHPTLWRKAMSLSLHFPDGADNYPNGNLFYEVQAEDLQGMIDSLEKIRIAPWGELKEAEITVTLYGG